MGPGMLLTWGVVVAAGVVNLAFTYGVAVDAARLSQESREIELAPAWAWILATVLFGPVMAMVYWLVNRSRLRPPAPEADSQEGSDPLAELFEDTDD